MMTQSNASRASSISRRIRSEVRPAIGSDVGRPAGSIVEPLRHLVQRQLASLVGAAARRSGRRTLSMPNTDVQRRAAAGRRR